MVRTSNWPPLVAMSVVTRWRSTFSSSVTHLTDISGFFLVNSPVSPCMRIMSPLFTVAIVRVVSAIAGTANNRQDAPQTAPRTCFTVTSLSSRF
ncbi:ABC-type transport system involved in cytochrome bd biosynthesis fused ATPase/permease subunit [Bradyrhizobium sp. F1.13.1]